MAHKYTVQAGPGRRGALPLVEKARTRKSGRIATEATEAKTQARFIAFVRERRRLFHINTVMLLTADEIGEGNFAAARESDRDYLYRVSCQLATILEVIS
jgi:hypothetical protein